MDVWILLIWVLRLANLGLALTALAYNIRFFYKFRPFQDRSLVGILAFHIVTDCVLVCLSLYLLIRLNLYGPPMLNSIIDDLARIGTLMAYCALAIEAALREYPWTQKK